MKEFNIALTIALSVACRRYGMPAVWSSVLFEFLPDNILRLVATDGHRLAIVDMQYNHEQSGRYAIHLGMIENYLKNPCTGYPCIYVFDGKLWVTDCTVIHEFNPLPDPYPDYEKVLRSAGGKSLGYVAFNADYLSEMFKVCEPICNGTFGVDIQAGDISYFSPGLRSDLVNIRSVTFGIMPKAVK